MKTMSIRPAIHALMAAILAFAMPLAAVELSPSGEGDALIFPIWATTNGNLSVLSVVDSQQRRYSSQRPTSAVKLLLRDAQGQLLFGANLYLHNGEDSWTASIVSLPDGRSRLASSDDSCVLISEAEEAVPWSGSVDLDADHGFIELIVMGTFPMAIASVDCAGLAERWNSGVWSQDPDLGLDESNSNAALRGTLNLVNVPKGTAYTIPATALREFSDIPQHTAPNSAVPDLSSAHDDGTSEGATRSRTCDISGCREETWARPLDAVAAALLAEVLEGEYTRSETLAGRSDLIFTFPLRHHFDEQDHPYLSSPAFQLVTSDRQGSYSGGGSGDYICPPLMACYAGWTLRPGSSVSVLSFLPTRNDSILHPTQILGIGQRPLSTLPHTMPPSEGLFFADFKSRVLGYETPDGIALPVIGLVLQQFENGNLIDSDGITQRANYGVALPMTRGEKE